MSDNVRNYTTQKMERQTIESCSCLCDKCGEEFKDKNIEDVTSINTSFINSGAKYENQMWNYDMCAKCMVEMFKSFKIAPHGFMQNYTDAKYIKEEFYQEIFDNWKLTDKWLPYIGYSYDELAGMLDGWYHTTEIVNELILEYYPDRELLMEF